jgi:hypothetical protein
VKIPFFANSPYGFAERRGIEWVRDAERRGNPRELVWLWAAPNIGFVGVVFGMYLVTMGLGWVKASLAAVVAVTFVVVIVCTTVVGMLGLRVIFAVQRALAIGFALLTMAFLRRSRSRILSTWQCTALVAEREAAVRAEASRGRCRSAVEFGLE